MKKFVSIILSIATVLSIAVPSFAEETKTTTEYSNCYRQEITATATDCTDFLSEEAYTGSSDFVAIMYLCVSGPHAPYYFGHTWICIRNISDEVINIGESIINPGMMESFGLHHFDGMHYDREMNNYRGETVKAREFMLTKNDISSAMKEITDSRWHWYEYFTHNCTNFATSVWQETTGQHYFTFCFPFVVQIQMAVSGTKGLSIKKYE